MYEIFKSNSSFSIPIKGSGRKKRNKDANMTTTVQALRSHVSAPVGAHLQGLCWLEVAMELETGVCHEQDRDGGI